MILFLFVLTANATNVESLHRQCFAESRGRACVELGTSLWQNPAHREEARAAFRQGCKLKQESACTLKDLKSETPHAEKPQAAAKPAAKSSTAPQFTLRKIGPDTFAAKRTDALEYAGNPQANAKDARLEKHMQDGAPDGYELTDMDAGSVFAQAGFQLGDVIVDVNGQSVVEKNALTALLASAILEDTYRVHVRRAGKTLTKTIQLED
jgi:C-terminal processing protease CtpA/Prc